MKKTTLVITDEVNCRFTGLDVVTRRKLSNEVKFMLPYARHTPAFKLGRWDGTVRFCDIGGRTQINVLDRLLPIVEKAGYAVEIEDHREPHNFEFDLIDANSYQHIRWPQGHRFEGEGITVMDHQVEAVNHYLQNPQSLQCLSTAAGKCQPYDSKVLTPKGWVNMGDVSAGDKVVTPSGLHAEVLAVFEPGIKQVYELELKDGRRVRSCGDHLWPVFNINWKNSKTGPVRLLSTQGIVEQMQKSKRPIGIPLVSMENDDADADLPMDPWLLGFLLGDGGFLHRALGFSTADQEIVTRIENLLHEDYALNRKSKNDYLIQFKDRDLGRKRHGTNISNLRRNHLGHIQESGTSANIYIQILIDLGLYGKLSHEKFVPEIYFRGSKHQRMELIRGLVDSDGTIDKKSVCFTSTSHRLARDFQSLIHSVGGLASFGAKRNRTYSYKGEKRSCRDSFHVRARYPEPWNLVWLPRKKDLCGSSYQFGPTLNNRIVSVTPIGEMPVKCVLIDDPSHLYITDDYVMTHNTLITGILSHRVEPYGRSIVIVPSQDLVTQTEEMYRNMGLDVGVFYGGRKDIGRTHTICTWQSLEVLNKRSRDYDPDFSISDFIDGVVCVMVDECHGLKGEVLRKLMTTVFARVPIRWGMTGTIPREEADKMALVSSIGPVINTVKASELQAKGLLADLQIEILQLDEPVKAFRDYASESKHVTGDSNRISWLAQHIKISAQEGNTLILVNRLETGRMLNEAIPDSVFISGSMKSKDRKTEYRDVQGSDGKVIIATYGVAAVGIDIPRIFNLYLFEPGKSFIRVIQSIGRGIRKAKDKDFVQVYDICCTHKYSKKHLTERKRYYREQEYPHRVRRTHYLSGDTGFDK